MKIKLTYEEACSVLRQELGQYLALNEIDPDIEIEIEFPLRNPPLLMSGQIEAANELTRLAQETGEYDPPWQPDGKAPPPSADAFMAWAKGRKVCIRWNPTTPLTVDSIDDKWANFLYANGNKDRRFWKLADWQEYTDAN